MKTKLILAILAASVLCSCQTAPDGSTKPDPAAIAQIGGIIGGLLGQPQPAPAP